MTTAPSSTWSSGDRSATWGRVAVGVITLVVAVTWLPSLFAPLGDNHEGRIYGLVSLQVSNLWDLGWSASSWGTSMAPFGTAYSHHPPAFSLWYVPAWRLPGDSTVWIRVVPYLLGLSFLPASAAVLARRGLRWGSAAVAVGLVAATPLYWVYGRIWPALGLVALLTWVVADLRERDHVSGARLAGVCALAAFTIAANWFSLAAAALLGLWLLAGRGLDRVTVVVGTTMAVAAAATFAWVVAAPDAVGVLDQFALRTSGGRVHGRRVRPPHRPLAVGAAALVVGRRRPRCGRGAGGPAYPSPGGCGDRPRHRVDRRVLRRGVGARLLDRVAGPAPGRGPRGRSWTGSPTWRGGCRDSPWPSWGPSSWRCRWSPCSSVRCPSTTSPTRCRRGGWSPRPPPRTSRRRG